MEVPIGERLVQARTSKGWTQSDLAQRSGVSQAQISLIEGNERRNPGVNTLIQLEQALELEHGALSRPPPRRRRKAS